MGVRNPDHVSCCNIKSGMKVVTICIKSSGITILSVPLIIKSMPINISNKPKIIINVENDIQGIVFSNNLCTKPLAGDKPITFNKPNQKKIINRPNLAKGTDTLRKKCINLISIVLISLMFSISNAKDRQ